MKSKNDLLEELRTLLGQQPSEPVFRAVLAFFDTLSESEDTAMYLNEAKLVVSHWPSAVRRVEAKWKHLPLLYQNVAWPLVQTLELDTIDIASSPDKPQHSCALDSVVRLRLRNVNDSGLAHLLVCSQLRQLESFDVSESDITDDGISALSQSRTFTHLRDICVALTKVSGHGLAMLLSTPPRRLKRVCCDSSSYGSEVVAQIANKEFDTFPEFDLMCECGDIVKVASSPRLCSKVRKLTLSAVGLNEQAWERFADVSTFSLLEELVLPENALTVAMLMILSRSSWISQLKVLDASYNPIGDEGLAIIAECSFQRIESVILSDTIATDVGAKVLAQAEWLTGLQVLDLSNNEITALGLSEVITSGHLQHLRDLNLENNPIGDCGASLLADWHNGSNLRVLNIGNCEVSEIGIHAICSSKNLSGLTDLYMGGNQVVADRLRAMPAPNLSNLRLLHIGYCNLENDGCAWLSEGQLSRLQWLDLTGNNTSSEGVRILTSTANLKNLLVLRMDNNPIGDDGARAIGSSSFMRHLVVLWAWRCAINPAGAQLLLGSNGLLWLENLRLWSQDANPDWCVILPRIPTLRPILKGKLGEQ